MEVLVSPPPATITVFVTDAGAFTATFALIVMGGAEAPAAMAAVVVQVTDCPAALQLQFVPVALTNIRFGSSVSVTLIKPELAPFPTLVAWIPYITSIPAVKFAGEAPFDTVRSGVSVGGPLLATTEKLVPPPFTKYAEFCCGTALVLKTRL